MTAKCTFDIREDIPQSRQLDLDECRSDSKWPEDYTLTPESLWEKFEENPEESQEKPWDCPHEAVSEDRCIFHLDPEEYEKYEVDQDDERTRFLEALDEDKHRCRRFFGATFKKLDLSQSVIDGPHNYPIDLHFATVEDELDLSDAVVSLPIRAPGIRVDGTLNLDDTIFKRDVSFFQGEFPGVVSAIDGRFEEARFRGADFRSNMQMPARVQFQWIQFEEYTDFRDAEFDAAVFHDVDAGELHFENATFEIGHIDELLLDEELNFKNATFAALNLAKSTIEAADFSETTLQETDLSSGNIDWVDSDEEEEDEEPPALDLSESTVRHLDFTEVTGTAATDRVRFVNATIDGGTLDVGDLTIQYDFTEATVGSLTLRNLDEHLFGDHIRFWKTTFEGFDFSQYHDVLEATNWQIHPDGRSSDSDDEDGEYDDLILTYLRAKNGANHVSDNVAASRFFVTEMIYKRKRHFQQLFSTSGRERLSHAVRYLQNWFLNVTSRYGERASITVVAGVIAIFLWQFIVTAAPALSEVTGLLESFFVALAVFSLTRSIYR